ncbi:MAG: CvpA family protein [Sphaerochaetaceae bacterium]
MADWGITIGSYVFNIVDVIIVALAFMGAVAGGIRGFAMEFSSRAGFLIGLMVALVFTKTGTPIIVDTFGIPLFWCTLIAFTILFIIGYLLMMMAGTLLDKTLDALRLDWLDRLLGFFLGIAEILVLVAFIIYVLDLQQVIDVSQYIDSSVISERIIRPLTPKGVELVKGIL